MFAYRATRAGVDLAFTDRYAADPGVPGSSELDLGERATDLTGALDTVVAAFTGWAPPPPAVRMHQVHGAEVTRARAADVTPVCDGLVTAEPGMVLMVRAADCVPVLLADPDLGLVGAAHAGRRGLASGIVPAAVAALWELGARRLQAWIGPSVCASCYEVPGHLRDEVASVVPAAWGETSWGTPALDLVAGVGEQLRREGCDVESVPTCTRENPTLYSHRRQGDAAGRCAGLVWARR